MDGRRMDRRVRGLLCFLGLLVWMSGSAAAADLKVGVFDMGRILKDSEWGGKIQEEFMKQGKALQSQIDEKKKELEEAITGFEKQEIMMDDEAKKKRQMEIRKMQIEGEQMVYASNQKLTQLRNQLNQPLVDKVLEIVKQMGEKEGFDLVLEEGYIPYASSKLDITDKLISKLNKTTPTDLYKQ